MSRNINGSGAAGDCIVITASHVTLNLAGFTIGGPGFIGNVPMGHGIVVQCCGVRDVAIRNGTVTGWVSGVIATGGASGIIVERIRAVDNDAVGIYMQGNDAVLNGNFASDNGNDGIVFFSGSVVTRNVSNGNGDEGFNGICDSVIMFNTAINNGTNNMNIAAQTADCVIENNSAP